jgi:hypothetical protein
VAASKRLVAGGFTLRKGKTIGRELPETDALDGNVSTVSASNLSLHDLFAQQARHMLERADLDEEQKQTILVAMSCPCCGAGGMSFSVKLKPE